MTLCEGCLINRCYEDPLKDLVKCGVAGCPFDKIVKTTYVGECCKSKWLDKYDADKEGKHPKMRRECGHWTCTALKKSSKNTSDCRYCASEKVVEEFRSDMKILQNFVSGLSTAKTQNGVENLIAHCQEVIKQEENRFLVIKDQEEATDTETTEPA